MPKSDVLTESILNKSTSANLHDITVDIIDVATDITRLIDEKRDSLGTEETLLRVKNTSKALTILRTIREDLEYLHD
jgi:hypothetical protein